MSAHTPGPWEAGEDGHGIWAMVDGVERRIADVSARALLGDSGSFLSQEQKAQRIATANLIAAAPALLAELEQAVVLIESSEADPDALLAQLRANFAAAIARVRGGQ